MKLLRALPWLALAALAATGSACRRGDTASASLPTAGASPVAHFHDGAAYRYRLRLESRAEVAANPTPVAFELKGELVLSPRLSGSTVAFLGRIRAPELRGEGDSVPPEIARDLEGPWGFDLVDGQARSLRLRAHPKPFLVGILSTLAAAFQYPSGPPKDGTWEVEEVDGAGRYQARYATGLHPGSFTKTKLSYRATATPMTAGPFRAMDLRLSVVASTADLRLRGDNLIAVEVHDDLEATLTSTSRVRSTTKLALTLDEHGAAPDAVDWQSFWSSTSVVPIGSGLKSERAVSELDQRQAANVTFSQALAALEQEHTPAPGSTSNPMAASAPDEPTARRRLGAFGTMVAVLRTHPEDVHLALQAVHRGSPARKGLLDALGSAGGREAQAALVQEMQDPRAPDQLRRGAAFALIRTAHPVEPSVSALIDGLNDPLVGPYAVYGLGTYARRLREAGEVALANRAGDALLARLEATTNSSARVEVLRGIANSGDTRALVKVRPLLDDPDESIRAAAVDAIRLMPDPDVDALVVGHLGAGEKPNVRLAALDAAALRGPNEALASAVAGAGIGAPDKQSRLRAVRVLEKWPAARPEARAALEQIARTDGDESVQAAAKAALATPGAKAAPTQRSFAP